MNLEQRARARAGTAALNVFHDFGEDRARAIYCGYAAAFLLALRAIAGEEAVWQLVRENMSTPPKNSKPRLAYSRGSDLPAA